MSSPAREKSSQENIKQLIAKLQRPAWKFWVSPEQAARDLAALGQNAQEAVPHLIEHIQRAARATTDSKILDKTVVHGAFAGALVAIGEPALEPLMKAFAGSDEGMRYSAVEIVARFGEVALPKLISLLRSGSNEAKANAAWAIASIGPKTHDAVPALNIALAEALKPDSVALVHGKDGSIREVEIRKEYTEAESEFLRNLLSHQDPKPFQLRDHGVVVACLAALGAIGAAASEARPTVEYALKVGKDDTVVRISAESTLKKI